jgi:hypothetical protein
MTNESHAERTSPFACVMDAIEPDKREQHISTAKQLFRSIKEFRELPNGYAFHLPDEPDMLLKIAEFISLERLCCPFLGFTLEVEPERGAVWLKLTGREGVKPFLRAEIAEFTGDLVAIN